MIDSALPHDKVNYPINVTQIFQKKVMRDSNFQLFLQEIWRFELQSHIVITGNSKHLWLKRLD